MCFIQSLFDVNNYEGKYEYITDELNGTIASFIVRQKGKQKFSDLPERVREILEERSILLDQYLHSNYL